MRHGERKRRQTMKCLEATIRTVRSPRWLSGGEKTDVMCSKRIVSGTSLVVQWLRGHLAMLRVWVRSPEGEVRSHMPWGQKNQNIKQKQYCKKKNPIKILRNGSHQK